MFISTEKGNLINLNAVRKIYADKKIGGNYSVYVTFEDGYSSEVCGVWKIEQAHRVVEAVKRRIEQDVKVIDIKECISETEEKS